MKASEGDEMEGEVDESKGGEDAEDQIDTGIKVSKLEEGLIQKFKHQRLLLTVVGCNLLNLARKTF